MSLVMKLRAEDAAADYFRSDVLLMAALAAPASSPIT